MNQIKAFGKWETEGIVVEDMGLKNYISLSAKVVPKTGARYAGSRFHKSKIFIVERLINKVMNPGHKSKKHFKTSGHCTGKSATAYQLVQEAFEAIEKKTGQNPVDVFVQALQNAAPREEIITIEYGGARYPKAVECAPQRRIDIALRMLTQGTYHKSFNGKAKASSILAQNIIDAFKLAPQSMAISKKLELERTADSSR